MYVYVLAQNVVRKTSCWYIASKPATACTMRVPVLGMLNIIWGWLPQPTGSSDRRLQRTRTQCPAVLTRPLADPHSHADLIGRHGECHRGFRLSSENRRQWTILISAEKDKQY